MSTKADKTPGAKSFSPYPYVFVGYATIALSFGVFGTWAATAPLASGIVAPGMVVVSSNRKVIQHLEGGIVSEIAVKGGAIVDAGDVLVRLDATQAEGNFTVLSERLALLKATEARLVAESLDAEEISFPPEVLGTNGEEPLFVTQQKTLFRDRKATKDGQIRILQSRVGQLQEEVGGLEVQEKSLAEQRVSLIEQIVRMEDGQKKGYVSTNQVAQLMRGRMELEGNIGRFAAEKAKSNQSIAEMKLQILQLGQEFVERASTELRDVRNEVAEVAERVKQAEDILDRTVIRAPVRGMVQNIRIHTKSGIVRSAEPLMEIVPTDDELIIDARVHPMDVDGVVVGSVAEVRFPALPSRMTPVIMGSVEVLSPDIIQPENPQAEPYYDARVRVKEDDIPAEFRGKLLAGMPAEVIVAGPERTLVDYLVQPLTDSFSKGMLEH